MINIFFKSHKTIDSFHSVMLFAFPDGFGHIAGIQKGFLGKRNIYVLYQNSNERIKQVFEEMVNSMKNGSNLYEMPDDNFELIYDRKSESNKYVIISESEETKNDRN